MLNADSSLVLSADEVFVWLETRFLAAPTPRGNAEPDEDKKSRQTHDHSSRKSARLVPEADNVLARGNGGGAHGPLRAKDGCFDAIDFRHPAWAKRVCENDESRPRRAGPYGAEA